MNAYAWESPVDDIGLVQTREPHRSLGRLLGLCISVTFKRGTIRSSIAAQNEPRIDTTPMTAAA